MGGGVLLVIILTKFISGNGEGVVYEFAEASYLDIVQEVSVTGTVEADSKIDLRFQRAGKINSIPVKVGDFVSKGDMLASLNATSLAIQLDSARANLALARANYDQAVAGSTDQAVLIAGAALDKAQADYNQAVISLSSTTVLAEGAVYAAELDYRTALTNYENAVATYGEEVIHTYEDAYNVIDDILGEVDDSLRDIDNILGVDNETANDDFELSLEATSNQYTDARNLYSDVSDDFFVVFDALSEISASDYDEIDEILVSADDLLSDMGDLLDDVDDLLVDCPVIGGMSITVKDSKRSIIATEIDNINTISTSLDNAAQDVESAGTDKDANLKSKEDALNEANQALAQAGAQADSDISTAEVNVAIYSALLAQADASLAEVEAGPRDVDLASLEAAIAAANASVALAQYNLSEAYIYAPVSGVITEVNFDVSENVNANDDFLVMVSQEYQITANVSETDISKVQVGDKVMMTLDAFSYDKEFEAEIIEIDPAETVLQGVIYYQITAAFTAEDTDIKPGMTANMDIVTAELEGVLAVPVRAVKYDGLRTYVLQVDALGQTYETDIETGVRGDQYVEILSGLFEGEEVVTYVR